MFKLLLVVALFALLTYATIRVIERRGVKPAVKPRGQRPPPPRPMGPDDDDDFLRDLDRKKREPEDPDPPLQ